MSTNNVFIEFINNLKAIETQIKDLQAEAESIKDCIKAELTEAKLDEYSVGDYKITYCDVVSNRFDGTNFKKQYAELYKQYTKQTAYKRLTIN